MLYNIAIDNAATAPIDNGVIIKIGFGDPSTNDKITPAAAVAAAAIASDIAGKVALINGPASLPVACALSHAWSHIAAALAVYDPKLNAYIVCVSHDPAYAIGGVIK